MSGFRRTAVVLSLVALLGAGGAPAALAGPLTPPPPASTLGPGRCC